MENEIFCPKNIETYLKDGRWPIEKLYESYATLLERSWIAELIYYQETETTRLPVYCFKTPNPNLKLPGMIVLGGVHGEEPAPPIAFAKNIERLAQLIETKIPIAILPLLNPLGYTNNQRFPNNIQESVGGADFVLPDPDNPSKPRKFHPSCPEAGKLIPYLVKLIERYKPVLWIDHHEDLDDIQHLYGQTYIYSQGLLGFEDPIAQKIVRILKEEGSNLAEGGKTSFNEPIKNGIVYCDEKGNPIQDSSIEELAACGEIIKNNKIVPKHPISSVITTETSIHLNHLEQRVATQSRIMSLYHDFWKIAKEIPHIV